MHCTEDWVVGLPSVFLRHHAEVEDVRCCKYMLELFLLLDLKSLSLL